MTAQLTAGSRVIKASEQLFPLRWCCLSRDRTQITSPWRLRPSCAACHSRSCVCWQSCRYVLVGDWQLARPFDPAPYQAYSCTRLLPCESQHQDDATHVLSESGARRQHTNVVCCAGTGCCAAPMLHCPILIPHQQPQLTHVLCVAVPSCRTVRSWTS